MRADDSRQASAGLGDTNGHGWTCLVGALHPIGPWRVPIASVRFWRCGRLTIWARRQDGADDLGYQDERRTLQRAAGRGSIVHREAVGF